MIDANCTHRIPCSLGLLYIALVWICSMETVTPSLNPGYFTGCGSGFRMGDHPGGRCIGLRKFSVVVTVGYHSSDGVLVRGQQERYRPRAWKHNAWGGWVRSGTEENDRMTIQCETVAFFNPWWATFTHAFPSGYVLDLRRLREN